MRHCVGAAQLPTADAVAESAECSSGHLWRCSLTDVFIPERGMRLDELPHDGNALRIVKDMHRDATLL
jgi:hypothetical protein